MRGVVQVIECEACDECGSTYPVTHLAVTRDHGLLCRRCVPVVAAASREEEGS